MRNSLQLQLETAASVFARVRNELFPKKKSRLLLGYRRLPEATEQELLCSSLSSLKVAYMYFFLGISLNDRVET